MDSKIENASDTEQLEDGKKSSKKEKIVEEKGPKEIKTKALLSTLPDHPLSLFQSEVKKRNIKDSLQEDKKEHPKDSFLHKKETPLRITSRSQKKRSTELL